MELLDVVDENNNLINKVLPREVIHEKGIFHREVGVIIINQKHQILLERRSPNKKQAPNKWALCAGHIEAGDIPDKAIIREMQEEIGVEIDIKDLEFIEIIKICKTFSNNQYNNTFQYIYLWKTDKEISEFTIQKEELTEVKFFDFKLLGKKNFNKDCDFDFLDEKYIEDLLKKVKEKI